MTYDVVIAGAGVAGLAAAAYAAKKGLSVLVIDRQPKVGGLVQSIKRNGYTFDTGLRAVENAGIVLPFLKDLGIEMDYVTSTVSVGIEDKVIDIAASESLNDYENLLKHFFPDTQNDIDLIMRAIRQVMKNMDVMYGIVNPLIGNPFIRPIYMITTLIPWAIKFFFTIGKINKMNQPVEEYLQELSSNESLQHIIGQHFFKGTPAFFAMSYFSVYLDYVYPKGGSGKLTELLFEYLKKAGVQFALNGKITNINCDDRFVKTNTGKLYSYKHLIWAGDLKYLYKHMHSSHPEKMKIIESKSAALVEPRGGDSVFSLYLYVNKAPSYFAEISRGHFFYSPSHKGLGDINKGQLERLKLQINDSEDSKNAVKDWLYRFFYFNSLEISIPVLKDPDMAPEGKSGVMVLTLFDYDLVKAVDDAGWYDEFKQMCEESMIRVLSESIYPGIGSFIDGAFSYTPLTIERLSGNSGGAITGWAFSAANPAVQKIQQTARAVETEFVSISVAGQWTYSPAGVPMSILTGKLAAERANKNRNKH